MIDTIVAQKIIKVIIEQQETIIGPVALQQANKVTGLKTSDGGNLKIEIHSGDPDKILTQLVEQYEHLFGLASVEVCKDAVKEVKPPVPADELPEILK